MVNGELEVSDAVLAKAKQSDAFNELCAAGVLIVRGGAKAKANTPEPKAPEPTPETNHEPTPEPKAEGGNPVEPKAKVKTK
jgi:hypothetical protein